MAARTPERILDSIVRKKGKGALARRRMVANKDNNWLLALTLNSFAKVADGAKLSDLEETVVAAFRKKGVTEAELKAEGRLAKQVPQQVRDEVFPRGFAQLNGKKSYSFKDLSNDADGLVKSALSLDNVNRIDVEGIHAGRATLRDFPAVGRTVSRELGGELTVALEAAAATAKGRYTIKAVKFRCNDRQDDAVLGPSNEPYWIFGSLGDDKAATTRSQTFGDVDNGESRTFKSNEGCIWGQNCSAQELPDGEVGVLVSLWEHDEGNQEALRKKVEAAFLVAAGILKATGVKAWVGAVIAALSPVVQWFLRFLDDDHIADQTFVFSSGLIQKQIPKVGQSFDVTKRFSDGDGDYTLTLRVTHVS